MGPESSKLWYPVEIVKIRYATSPQRHNNTSCGHNIEKRNDVQDKGRGCHEVAKQDLLDGAKVARNKRLASFRLSDGTMANCCAGAVLDQALELGCQHREQRRCCKS
jgi:hypothetical protein